MRTRRVLMALFAPTSFYFAVRRPWRALAFIVPMLLAALLALRLGAWIVPLALVLHVAHLVDVLRLEVPEPPSGRDCLVIGFCVYLAAIAVTTTVRAKLVEAFKIPSGGDIPTLQVGDHILVDKRARHPGRGDVIVFIHPVETDKDFVKRVIAVGGDTVAMEDGELVINGKRIAPTPAGPCSYQEYDEMREQWHEVRCDAYDEQLDGHHYRIVRNPAESGGSFAPRVVPADSFFVMGDNRDNSADSRFWGFVPAANVKGTARIVWWSWGPDGMRWGRLNHPVP